MNELLELLDTLPEIETPPCDGCGEPATDTVAGTHFHCDDCGEIVEIMFEEDMAAELESAADLAAA